MAGTLTRPAAQAIRPLLSTPVAKHSVRRLHITGANASSQYLKFEGAVAELPRRREGAPSSNRHFNTSRSLKAVNDSSTIDFAYMPSMSALSESLPFSADIRRIPLLPDNFYPNRNTEALKEAAEETVLQPQIETASANDNHVVSAMTEVTDNHSAEIDVYALTEQVSKAVQGAMQKVNLVVEEKGIVRELWDGLLDDLLGAKQPAKPKAA